MVFVRCAHFDDNGMPIGKGCKKGAANCDYVHPSAPAAWARAPQASSNFAKAIKSRATASSAGDSSLGQKGAKKTRAPAQFGASASFEIPPAYPASSGKIGGAGSSKPFLFDIPPAQSAFGPASSSNSSGAGSSRSLPFQIPPLPLEIPPEQPAVLPSSSGPMTAARRAQRVHASSADPPKPMQLGDWFASGEQSVIATGSTPVAQTTMAALAPAPTLRSALPTLQTDTAATKPTRVGVDRSRFSESNFKPASPEELQPLSDPPSALATLAPRESSVPQESSAPAQPKFLTEIHAESKSFIKQLLDAVFKTQELMRAEHRQAATKRLTRSTRYERASTKTRATLETLRVNVEEDRVVVYERLKSRLSRLADLPNVGDHLVKIVPAIAGANTEFDAYLAGVEAWRHGLEPDVQRAKAAYEERVRKEEEALLKDDRPEWLKKVPQLTGRYEELVQLERAANKFKLERDGRYDEPEVSLVEELFELFEDEDGPEKLQMAVEDSKQEAADTRTMQLVDNLRHQDAELRQQLVEAESAVGVMLEATQDEEEPDESLADYMENMRRKIRRKHEQHAERASVIRAQHAQVDELTKQSNPTAAPYDTSELAGAIESRVQEHMGDGFISAIARLLEVYHRALSHLMNDAVEHVGEAMDVIRLVNYYVDGNEELKDALIDSLQEHLAVT